METQGNQYELYIAAVAVKLSSARLAQSVEHETLNLGVVGSSPTRELYFIIVRLYYVVFLNFVLNKLLIHDFSDSTI